MQIRGRMHEIGNAGTTTARVRKLTKRSRSCLSIAGFLGAFALGGCSGGDVGNPLGATSQDVKVTNAASGNYVISDLADPTGTNGPTLGLADFEFDSNNMPLVSATGQYSVTMQFDGVATSVTLRVDGTDADSFSVPARGSSVQITRELELQQDAVARTATGTLEFVLSNSGATLQFAVISPLRKTSVVDANATGFNPADGAGSSLFNDSCAGCHAEKYRQWRSSMMGYSSISPPIHNLELTENHVDPSTERDDLRDNTSLPPPSHGRFARSPGAPNSFDSEVHSQSPSSLFCQRCHAPSATFTDVMRVFDLDYSQERGSIPDNHQLLSFLVETDLAALQGTSDTDPSTVAALGNYETLLRDLDPGNGSSGRFYQEMDASELEQLQLNARAGTEGVTCTVCHSVNGLDQDGTPARTDLPNEAGIGNSGFRVVHLDDSDEERINFGPYADEEIDPIRAHELGRTSGDLREGTDGMMRPFIQTGEMCGTCHDVRIGDDDFGPNGVREGFPNGDDGEFRRVENLFTEWRDSPWNNNDSPVSANLSTFENPRAPSGNGNLKTSTSCQDCHMSMYMTHDDAGPGEFVMENFGGELRRNSNHRFVGVDRFLVHDVPVFGDASDDELKAFDISLGREPVDPETGMPIVDQFNNPIVFTDFEDIPENEHRDLREILLQKAAELRIESVGQVAGNLLPVAVSVENVGVGHNLPAGLSQERQVWIELEVLDANGAHVYTSGYLNPLPESGEPMFNPGGALRYQDSYCAKVDPATMKKHEYECELDFFRIPENATIGPDLSLQPMTMGEEVHFEPGLDPMLSNYQNGFTLGAFNPSDELENKVLTQFIGDHIVNTNSLAPFEKRVEEYMIPVAKVPGEIRNGPYTVNARLRFRPLPLEFLEGLQKAFGGDPATATVDFPSRITKEAIANNKVIEMESDGCVTGGFAESSLRACGRVDDGSVTTVAAGLRHTCVTWGSDVANPDAFATDGIANKSDYVRYTQCFGDNGFGQVGVGVTGGGGADEGTAETIDLINQATISAGDAHTCALHRGGTVSCWGAGAGGRLGDGDGSNHNSTGPREIDSTVLANVSTLASASSSTCAVTKGQSAEEDRVFCWGDGDPGELGSGGTPVSETKTVPSQIAATSGGDLLRGIEEIAAGSHHYCVIAEGRKLDEAGAPDNDALGNPAYSTGHVYCWGAGPGNGQDDAGSPTDVANPSPVSLPYQATKLAAGEDFSCALLTSGEVYCWGSNADGRLGVGNAGLPMSLAPMRIQQGESTVYDLVAGQKHACIAEFFSDSGLTHNVKCWGDGDNGKNGDSSETDRFSPMLVSYEVGGGGVAPDGFTGIVSMAAGAEHTCVASDGSFDNFTEVGLWCWGDNSNGQLGMSDITGSTSIASRLTFYDKGDPAVSTDDVEGDLPDPMITGRSYYATESRGGPGQSGCIVANFPFQQCVDEQDLVDVNGGDDFRYVVDAFGGMTELHFEVSKLSGFRSMEVFLNGNATGMTVQATAGMAGRVGTAPNRTGLELPPITLDLEPGLNEIILVDNQGTDEFDMHRVRLVRTQDGTCFDDSINNGETDLNCGGPFCSACEVGGVCGQDIDCSSGICESGTCQEPPDSSAVCDLSTATDLGVHGTGTAVTSDACLKITQYPSWWQPRPLKIRRDGGTVNLPFDWDNRGGGSCDPKSVGTGNYNSSVDEVVVGDGVDEHSPPPSTLDESTVTSACPTLIQLNGDGTPVTIHWWGN